MKITKEITPIAYELSKKVFEGKLTFKEGQEQLIGDNRMNPNSAADYINNFRCMIEGKRFTRTNNAFSIEYFLDNFYKDFGSSGLSNALTALQLHIEYYEEVQKVVMHKMRDIYAKYLAVRLDNPNEQEKKDISREFKNQNKTKHKIAAELKKEKLTLRIPPETLDKSKKGLKLLMEAVEEAIEANPEGAKNAELARHLGLQSDHNGNQKDYLTYSLIGLLLKENKIYRDDKTRRFKKL